MANQIQSITPVSLPSFQYGLANVRVGRSGYQDLADALSQINPALEKFGAIAATRNQLIEQEKQKRLLEQQKAEAQEKKLYESEVERGRLAFIADPSGVSEDLKRITRKAINAGVIPENANAPFIIGGLQAQGEVLVNRDYRDQLRSLVETTNDPEVAIAQTKAEFLKRPEFSDPSVRAYAAEVFGKVDDEFRKDVNSRLDAVRTEKSKGAWLELGLPLVESVVKGDIDINDPEMVGWVNRAAGVFKGSHKYAFDELIKPSILELVEAGGSALALEKVEEIENWVINPNTGAKFITAELRDDIDTFKRDIEGKAQYYQKKATELYNNNKAKVIEPYIAEVKEKLNDGAFSDSFFNKWINRLRAEGSESSVSKDDIEQTIIDMRDLADQDFFNSDTKVETDPETWTILQADLDKGLDILEDAQEALRNKLLSIDDFKSLQKLNGDSDRFNKEVMEGVSAVKRWTEVLMSQFRDTNIKQGLEGRFGLTTPSTNILKDFTGLNAHPNTLEVLKTQSFLAWRSKLKGVRDTIVKANPNITPQQLDEVLTKQSTELYAEHNEEFKPVLLSQLRTGRYILHAENELSVDSLNQAIKAINTNNPTLVPPVIDKLLVGLEFPDDLKSRLKFLEDYKNKIK